MPYCTATDVFERAPALKDDPLGQVRVSDGIEYSTALIEGRLKTRFSVPFADPAPKMIGVIAKDLAAAYALRSAFSGAAGSDQLAEAARMDSDAKTLLGDIASGSLHLSDAITEESIPSRTPPIHVTSTEDQTSVRTMDLLGRFGPKRP